MTVHDLPLPPLPPTVEDERAPHVLVARYRKARKLANALTLLEGANAASVADLGAQELGRVLAAQVAGVNVPSETTWALVVELVREVRP